MNEITERLKTSSSMFKFFCNCRMHGLRNYIRPIRQALSEPKTETDYLRNGRIVASNGGQPKDVAHPTNLLNNF